MMVFNITGISRFIISILYCVFMKWPDLFGDDILSILFFFAAFAVCKAVYFPRWPRLCIIIVRIKGAYDRVDDDK